MTADAVLSILEAELETGELLTETLNRQRQALIERDLDRISEITGLLDGQMEHFSDLVDARKHALGQQETPPGGETAELLRRIRRTEGRVLRLAELNQDLIADRLAYVGAMLSTLGLTEAAGYGSQAAAGRCPAGAAEAPAGMMSRSA